LQNGNKESVDGMHRIMKKILVIRLSSLGDVVLAAPVLYALRKQLGVEVHLLTKPKMGDLLHGGEAVDKFYTWGEIGLFDKLKAEKYDGILDLHCNFRSYWVRALLCLTISVGYNKKRLMRWLFVNTKSSRFEVSHVQDRYLNAAHRLMKRLGCGRFEMKDWAVGLPAYSKDSEGAQGVVRSGNAVIGDVEITDGYGVAILGGTYETKKIPKSIWQQVFKQDQRKWCLIGGPNEKDLAAELVEAFGDQLINGVGVFDLKTSSRWIAQSSFVVGGDTGFTHVAASFNKPLLVIWGSTDPGLGFSPGHGNEHVYHLLANDLSCHPCSKLGFDACPKGHFRCIEGHSPQELKLLLQKLQGISL
jgi:ADP-heptose:LPS heptosyltransferase